MEQDSTSKVNGANGADTSYESPYIKELQRNIRNVNKKLSLMQKVDSVIAANPSTSLDDLVAARKINKDQKAQALNKPALQASLAQFEEQIGQYKKFDEEYQQRSASEKERLKVAHAKELDDLRASSKAESAAESKQLLRKQLLTLSRFLRAAAARRQENDDSSDETTAFEGVLLLLYGGDNAAVDAAEKLIHDVEEGVLSTEGTTLSVTYAQINRIALDSVPAIEEEEPVEAEVPAVESVTEEQQTTEAPASTEETDSDPTIAHAGLTELNDVAQYAPVAPKEAHEDVIGAPTAATTGEEASNASATELWDSKPVADSLGESWISVPRDLSETETPVTTEGTDVTSSVVPENSQNWADDIPASAALPAHTSSQAATEAANDGFHEVHHGRGGRGRGPRGHEHRGGGGRGRGGHRGGRGDGPGRGRGGPRGERGDRGDRGRGRGPSA